jgi:hypothetical protein
MTSMEGRALEVLWGWGGTARVPTIARGLGVSLEYARLLTGSLATHGYLRVRNGWCALSGQGKLEAAKRKGGKPTKVVVDSPLERIVLGGNRRIAIGY